MPITISGPELAKLSPDLIADLAEASRRLAALDSSLWGTQAQAEAKVRLGWVTAPASADLLREQLSHLARHQRVVLCGMGGSSLAPEVIAASYRKELVVLDSTDPHQVSHALSDLDGTTFIIASKSGSTIETDSQRRAVEGALGARGLDLKDHIVVVTDPDSPLDQSSRAAGIPTINADPHVGGRFSALTAFGLTPAKLIDADIDQLISDANAATVEMSGDSSAAVLLAAAIVRHNAISPYITIAADDRTPGFGEWVEQLIAESTGKAGKGVLPIVVESSESPDFTGPDRLSISLSPTAKADLIIDAPLGAHFVLWEWATALVGYALGIDPFNQPNVAESKVNTAQSLEQGNPVGHANFSEDNIDVFTTLDVENLADLFEQLTHHAGYLAVMAYLDRTRDGEIARLRSAFGRHLPCTFGWGPRFLHSTGQFHKGGPQIGAFLQITGAYSHDLAIPGQEFSFATLNMAQALGDFRALASRDLPIARLHLHERSRGIASLIELAHAG